MSAGIGGGRSEGCGDEQRDASMGCQSQLGANFSSKGHWWCGCRRWRVAMAVAALVEERVMAAVAMVGAAMAVAEKMVVTVQLKEAAAAVVSAAVAVVGAAMVVVAMAVAVWVGAAVKVAMAVTAQVKEEATAVVVVVAITEARGLWGNRTGPPRRDIHTSQAGTWQYVH